MIAVGAASAALTAILASLCCAGPAVVAVLGVSGAVTVARLAPYQPYFLIGGSAVLAFAFWLAYRRSGTCQDGACSANASRWTRFTLWVTAAIMLAATLLYFTAA